MSEAIISILIKGFARVASLIGACGLIVIINGVRDTDVNPQNYENVSIISKQETMQNLMKYEFMQDSKERSYKLFREDVENELDITLQTAYSKSVEYAVEVEQLRKQKAALEQQQLEEADKSLDDLVAALDALENAADTISVIANDTPVVATGENTEGENEEEEAALIAGDRIDSNYHGQSIVLDSENRHTLECLVMGEAGNQGFIGAALVAQTIHDTMLNDGDFNVNSIRIKHGYTGSIDNEPNDDVKQAVAFIFDKGGMAVQHRLIYFYAPKVTSSDFHENQKFIVTYKGHKFFDSWE